MEKSFRLENGRILIKRKCYSSVIDLVGFIDE